MLVATGGTTVTYLVVVVNVEGIKCQALLDTGAGSFYASSALLERLQKQPIRRERRRIEMTMQSTNQVIELHKLKISNVDGSFHLNTEVTKVNRSQLLSLGNPKYKEKIASPSARYHHGRYRQESISPDTSNTWSQQICASESEQHATNR